jgi:hypothetical protein
VWTVYAAKLTGGLKRRRIQSENFARATEFLPEPACVFRHRQSGEWQPGMCFPLLGLFSVPGVTHARFLQENAAFATDMASFLKQTRWGNIAPQTVNWKGTHG